jgi:hypothetical protein
MLSKEIQLEVNKGAMLPLMEEFYTIHSRRFSYGTAAYFVRIGGVMWVVIGVMLKVGMQNCILKHQSSIDCNAKKYSETVVVTGGALMWDMTLLTQTLKENGRKVHIETSGAYPLTGTWDWICLSPKKISYPPRRCMIMHMS